MLFFVRTMFILAALLEISKIAYAGTFTAEIDKTESVLGDQFVYTLTISGSADGDPKIPQIDGLQIEGRGTSHNISIVNGTYHKEVSYQYIVVPYKAGTFTIPSITLKIDGQDVATLPIKFSVKDSSNNSGSSGAAPPTGPSPGGPPPGGGAGGGNDPQNESQTEAHGDVFIERVLSKTNPYVGEPVVSTIRIYYRIKLLKTQVLPQDYQSVKKIPLEGEKRYAKLVGTNQYQVVEISEILVPLKEGTVEIPPFVLDTITLAQRAPKKERRGGRSIFDLFQDDDFFGFGEQVQRQFMSKPTQMTVKSVPAAGKPQNFSNVIGDFKIGASLSAPRLKAGETSTLTVVVEGQGFLEGMPDISIPPQNSLKIYADKPALDQQVNASGIFSRKTFKFALVPTEPGKLALGELTFFFFNPQEQAYRTVKTPLGNLDVDPPSEKESLVVARAGEESTLKGTTKKEQIKVLGEDVIGLHREPSLIEKRHNLSTTDAWTLGGMGGGSFLLFFLSWIFIFFREKFFSDPVKMRRLKAYNHYAEVKAEADKLLKSETAQDVSQAMIILMQAVKGFLGDKLNVHGHALTSREVRSLLENENIDQDSIQSVCQLVERFEMFEFSGERPEQTALKELGDSIELIIKKIDKLC